MNRVAVLTPVLNRPHRAALVAESLRATCHPDVARIVFLCSPGDDAEIEACRKVRRAETIIVPFEREPGDYARKINYGVEAAESEWIFQGADDLSFHPRWLEEALHAASRTNQRVIGTQDLGNRLVKVGRHSTHSLVHRSYVRELGTVDEPGKLLHEGYRHNFCDTEMIETADARGEFRFTHGAVVEHLHPHWQKGEEDATYILGLSDFKIDQRLFLSRRKLWARSRRSRRR